MDSSLGSSFAPCPWFYVFTAGRCSALSPDLRHTHDFCPRAEKSTTRKGPGGGDHDGEAGAEAAGGAEPSRLG